MDGPSVGVTSVSMIEGSLDHFIEKRSKARIEAGEAPLDDQRREMWKESAERYHERERQRIRWEWARFYELMARNHQNLADGYRQRAEKLTEGA